MNRMRVGGSSDGRYIVTLWDAIDDIGVYLVVAQRIKKNGGVMPSSSISQHEDEREALGVWLDTTG